MPTKKPIFALLLLFLSVLFSAEAQVKYKGIWYGHIATDFMPVKSKYVLHVVEEADNIIKGKSYLFRDVAPYLFIGVLDFIGTINNNLVKITELKISKSEMHSEDLDNSFLCIKLLNLKFSTKDGTDFLTGFWNGSNDNGLCGPGTAALGRYNENDTTKTGSLPPEILEKLKNNVPLIFTFKETELSKPVILNVNSRYVTLEIKDYEKDDNDTISIFYNRRLIVNKLRIFKKAQKKVIRLDELAGLNEIVLYANNLGFIPPNTSLLFVDDGVKRQKVFIESTLQKSAVIYLNFQPKPK